MTTVINTPRSREDSSGMHLVVGVLVVLLVAFLFFTYALPAMRNAAGSRQDGNIDVNVKLPAGSPANNQPAGGTAQPTGDTGGGQAAPAPTQ